MPNPDQVTVIGTYRVRAGKEKELLRLLGQHWPMLRSLKLATDDPPQVYLGKDDQAKPVIYEVLTWLDEKGAQTAHTLPEVMNIWEKMGLLVEKRGERPAMEFPHVARVSVRFEKL